MQDTLVKKGETGMKPWKVVVDGKQYEVKAKGYKLVVNGEKHKLKNLMSKKDGMWRVYELPLGGQKGRILCEQLGRRGQTRDGRRRLCYRQTIYGKEPAKMGVYIFGNPSAVHIFPDRRSPWCDDGFLRDHGNDLCFKQRQPAGSGKDIAEHWDPDRFCGCRFGDFVSVQRPDRCITGWERDKKDECVFRDGAFHL